MQAPATPIDETQRLRSLTTLCVLDTLPEERFDRITRVACRTFGVPIALVSLVDRERQWFKSKQGLDACETPREVSFCGHAILREGALVVPDAFLDPRFHDNPLVTGAPHVRFYAGQPIHGPDRSRIGTLCLIDHQPREFSADDAVVLADLTAMVERELALMSRAATDELTQLSNRHGFTLVSKQVLALCRRNQHPAVLIGIDLDNFKSVNDEHGHEAGDHALRTFAKLLHSHFRDSDVVARLGGDEFAVLCSSTNADSLMGSLERLANEFTASALARDYPKLNWSFGLAEYRPDYDETIDDLLRTADARMYEAKVESRRRQQQR